MSYCENMGKRFGIDLNKIRVFYFFAKKRKNFCDYLESQNVQNLIRISRSILLMRATEWNCKSILKTLELI